jgi:hypothetical protein
MYLTRRAPRELVPRRRAPHWACTSLGVHIMGVHLMGVVCLEAGFSLALHPFVLNSILIVIAGRGSAT